MACEWIEIGKVRSVNPARRELRVQPFPAHDHEFESLERIRVRKGAAPPLRCRVLSMDRTGSEIRLRLSPGVSTDRVAAMKGGTVVLAAEEQHAPPEETVPVPDLLALDVFDDTGAQLGTVTGVCEAPANDVIVIRKPDGGEILLPLVEAVVRGIDLDARRMHVGDIGPHVVEN
jgi:16S rRNA processing protein RimM